MSPVLSAGVCLTKWESGYDTMKTHHNNDGSTDFGIFQITERTEITVIAGGAMTKSCLSEMDAKSIARVSDEPGLVVI